MTALGDVNRIRCALVTAFPLGICKQGHQVSTPDLLEGHPSRSSTSCWVFWKALEGIAGGSRGMAASLLWTGIGAADLGPPLTFPCFCHLHTGCESFRYQLLGPPWDRSTAASSVWSPDGPSDRDPARGAGQPECALRPCCPASPPEHGPVGVELVVEGEESPVAEAWRVGGLTWSWTCAPGDHAGLFSTRDAPTRHGE